MKQSSSGYQDERYTGRAIVDRALGVRGKYLYSFENDGIWHVLLVEAKAKGRGFKLGNPLSRPEGRIEVWQG